jgi:hypothetical protein
MVIPTVILSEPLPSECTTSVDLRDAFHPLSLMTMVRMVILERYEIQYTDPGTEKR